MNSGENISTWAKRIRRGDVRAAARACSVIEEGGITSTRLLRALKRHSGTARVIGVTGPPGAGKSTLLSRLVDRALKLKQRVGVVAVDPSSPWTGGAILADRLRMASSAHPNVFIRSIAARGMEGGLARSVPGTVQILKAMGKSLIFIETVGAGQNDVAVSQLADTVLYVAVPGLGDDIQALKAGILEAADVIAVNKSDLSGAQVCAEQLRVTLSMDITSPPPILNVSAARGQGVDVLLKELLRKKGKRA